MKKKIPFILSLSILVLTASFLVHAQKSTDVRQVIVANGGKFEGTPPYSDYVTVEAYNLATQVVTVFNTIYTQSVQDVIISGNHAYVTAQDSIVLYDIDTYQRVAAVADSGVNKMALYNDKLVVTKMWPVGRFRVEVLDAANLGLIALIDGIPGDCEGIAVYGDQAFVAIDSGFLGVEGHLAIVNLSTLSLSNVVNFGPSAIGSHSVYAYGGLIYVINRTPYGGGNIGSITAYNPANGNFVTQVLDVNIGPGYGISGNLLYLGINKSIGSYNLDTHLIVDTTIISYFGSSGAVEIHSAAVDYINEKFYTDFGNRTSFGFGVVFSFTGDSLTSYSTGINTDACAIDFRTPTGTTNVRQDQDIMLYPNPVNDYLGILPDNKSVLRDITIRDLTGRSLLTRPVQEGEKNIRIRVSDYPAGIYLISFRTDQGIMVRKVVKR
jgi:Secretion system C-terminal sorting domain